MPRNIFITGRDGGSIPPPVPNLNLGLVEFWKLDEAANITRVGSQGVMDLADVNANVGSVAGLIGNAAEFPSGVNALLENADPDDFAAIYPAASSFTVSAWINPAGALGPGDLFEMLGWFADLAFPGPTFFLICADALGDAIGCIARDSSFTPTVLFGSVPPPNAWTNALVEWDMPNQLLSLYIDGSLVQSGPLLDMVANAGDSNLTGIGVSGLSDIAIRSDATGLWNRLLTAPEKALLYNAGAGAQPPF